MPAFAQVVAPEQNARAFLAYAQGDRWYRTGDLVVEEKGTGYIFHGRRDRITSFRETSRYVDRARAVADSAELQDMGALGHYMLIGSGRWHDVAITTALDLLGTQVLHPDR